MKVNSPLIQITKEASIQMAVLFDFYESPPQEGQEEDKLRVHARPVFSQTVGTKQLATLLEHRTSLSRGDIYSTLTTLGQVMIEKLQDGQRIYLDGIGYFSVTLRSLEMETEKDMRADRVGVNDIAFRADKQFKQEVRKAKMKRVNRAANHSARLTPEEVDSRVAEYFKEHPVMTRKSFQGICEMKPGTAFRHIHRLVDEGKIKNVGTQRQPIYMARTEE